MRPQAHGNECSAECTPRHPPKRMNERMPPAAPRSPGPPRGTLAPAKFGRSRTFLMPIRVVLGEDNYIAREGISRVLERASGIELVAACADLETLRTTIDRALPDV